MDLPQPDPVLPHLADVVPALLAALGVPGFDDRIGLPGPVAGACVLLIDGLGAELLDTFAADAPVLAGLRGPTLQVGFPSTTVAGLAAVGTGRRTGEHGMVGISFRLPGAGLINALRWRPHPWGADLRDTLVPEEVQPLPTTFERASAAGVAVSVVSGAEFAGSGLTRAVLRGGRYVGVLGLGDLAANVRAALAGGGFCYGYHSELDLLGHLHGPGSQPWRMQLRQVDRLVESIVEGLPPGGLLAVVADHGIDLPDAAARERLLALYGRSLPLRLSDAETRNVVDRTDGVTASFLKELLRRAMLESLDDGTTGPAVTATHVSRALDDLLDSTQELTRSLLGVGYDPDNPPAGPSPGPPPPMAGRGWMIAQARAQARRMGR